MDGVCFLAETYGHPMYLGIKGSKALLHVLQKKLDLKLSIKKMDKEIIEIEKELLKRTAELQGKTKESQDVSYIG